MYDYICIGNKNLKELLALYSCNIREDGSFYENIAYNIEKVNRGYLLKNISKFKGKRLIAALFGLTANKDLSTEDITKIEKFLNYSDKSVVLACINTLILLESHSSWSKIEPLLKDKDPYVRGGCLRFASFKFGKQAIPLLLSYIKDKNEDSIIKMTVIDELEVIGNTSIIKYLKPLLIDKDEVIRSLVKETIENLKG